MTNQTLGVLLAAVVAPLAVGALATILVLLLWHPNDGVLAFTLGLIWVLTGLTVLYLLLRLWADSDATEETETAPQFRWDTVRVILQGMLVTSGIGVALVAPRLDEASTDFWLARVGLVGLVAAILLAFAASILLAAGVEEGVTSPSQVRLKRRVISLFGYVFIFAATAFLVGMLGVIAWAAFGSPVASPSPVGQESPS